MVIGDTLMTFGFAMLVVAFAAAFAGDSMFPDETDFRVLTPLPITRGVRVLGEAARRRLVPGARDRRDLAGAATAVHRNQRRTSCRSHLGGSSACVFGYQHRRLALRGHGSDGGPGRDRPVRAPRRYLRPMAVGTRTAILCGVVLLLPLAGRMPSQARGFLAESALLYLAPPAWFVGLQRVGLGVADGYDVRMAMVAIAALALTSVVVAACYVVLYRKFDVVMLRQSSTGSARGASMDSGLTRTVRLPPARRATVARSRRTIGATRSDGRGHAVCDRNTLEKPAAPGRVSGRCRVRDRLER